MAAKTKRILTLLDLNRTYDEDASREAFIGGLMPDRFALESSIPDDGMTDARLSIGAGNSSIDPQLNPENPGNFANRARVRPVENPRTKSYWKTRFTTIDESNAIISP